MNFFKPKQSPSPSCSSSKSPQPNLFLHQAFSDFQSHLLSFMHDHRHNPLLILFNRSLSPPTDHVESFPFDLRNHFPQLPPGFAISSSGRNQAWARISEGVAAPANPLVPLSTEAIEERLAGVPVYALINPSEEFVVISGMRPGKSLGLFCFKEEDAESLLRHVKTTDPGMRQGSRVVAVALSKVVQLKLDGVAFRLIPDSSQIKHALKERQKVGNSDVSFDGVPVFQSRSLILKSQDKKYRPLFFRKEDLEKSLLRASRQQKLLNPAYREGDIQVAVFEDIIQGMMYKSSSNWDDVVFIPPGFDVSTDASQQQQQRS